MTSTTSTSSVSGMAPDPETVERAVRTALEEDLRYGPDVTTAAVIPPGTTGVAQVVAREAGILAGLPAAAAALDVLTALDVPASSVPAGRPAPAGSTPASASAGHGAAPGARVAFTALAADGDAVKPGDAVAQVEGPLAQILTAERTMLNFLCHLSGIATATRAWADAIEGTGAFVRDTRKTIPGLRELEKYAVRCGGGVNHRMGLGDAALIKDNHVAAAGGVAAAFRAVRAFAPDIPVEVECDTLDQVREALAAGATLILLDNMDLDDMRAAASLARAHPDAKLEASGGLRLETARAVAETGVHYLSAGVITHSTRALDLGLDLLP